VSQTNESAPGGGAAAPTTFTAREGTPPGTWILSVAGEIDVATSPQLRDELHQLIDQGATGIVIDLSATTFMDSSGLGVLVGLLRRSREQGSGDALVLEGLQEPVRKVFEITGLNNVFTIR